MSTDDEGKPMSANKQPAVKQLDLDEKLDLTAQRLLAPLGAAKPQQAPTIEYSLDETSEIELTAEQMDDLLAGRWQP